MRLFMLAAGLLTSMAGVTAAADVDLADILAYHEEFDGPEPLRGIMKPGRDKIWRLELTDGVAIFSNDEMNAAVRFFDIPTAQFPLADERLGTDGTEVAASVRVAETGDGGIGVLVGYPYGGDYAVFAISGSQRFIVLKKTDGRLERVHYDTSEAVVAEAYNDVLVRRHDDRLRFVINGVEVFDMPADNLVDAPVGIAAFGRGQFEMESVSVRAPDSLVRRAAGMMRSCDLPEAADGDLVGVLGAYEGAALSTVSVAGQDERTSTIGIFVAPGEIQLHLVAVGYDPTIWTFTGAVDRVNHFAAVSRNSAAGVVGLPADKVSFHDADDCFGHFDQDSSEAKRAEVITSIASGSPVDMVASFYDPASFDVPSGSVTEGEEVSPVGISPEWDPDLQRELLRFNPAGLVAFDPAEVVSPAGAELYDILPQEAGLAQLVAEGVLVREGRDTFRVAKPMLRYPAGLAGAHSVNFIFPSDLPETTGSRGHSKIERELPPNPMPLGRFGDGERCEDWACAARHVPLR